MLRFVSPVVLACALLGAGCGSSDDNNNTTPGGGGGGGTAGSSGGGSAGSRGGAAGGTAGSGGGGTGAQPAAPTACGNLGIKTFDDVASKLIAPTCGKGPAGQICHDTIYPPTMLTNASMVKTLLLGKKAQVLCMNDFYINTTDRSKSFILAKINPANPNGMDKAVNCPSTGKPEGGYKMPYMPSMDLTSDQKTCLTWYVMNVQ